MHNIQNSAENCLNNNNKNKDMSTDNRTQWRKHKYAL